MRAHPGRNHRDLRMHVHAVEPQFGVDGIHWKAQRQPELRLALRQRDIILRIARRSIESKERLGRHRWVAERTLSTLYRFRRLIVRYERRDDIQRDFLSLGCALICWRFVQQ